LSGLFFLILDGSVEEGEKREQIIVEALYLYLEDLKQSKSDGKKEKRRRKDGQSPYNYVVL